MSKRNRRKRQQNNAAGEPANPGNEKTEDGRENPKPRTTFTIGVPGTLIANTAGFDTVSSGALASRIEQSQGREPVDNEQRELGVTSEIGITAPWEAVCQFTGQNTRLSGFRSLDDLEIQKVFLQERSRVHETFIREDQKTKRLSLLIVFLCVVCACLVLMFAPAGRENLSYGVAAALVIFAAGVSGFRLLRASAPGVKLDVSTDPTATLQKS